MLDLDHPQTPHVFAASCQQDLVLGYCKRITLSDAATRRFMLEVIRPAFAAMRWLGQQRFNNAKAIAFGIDQFECQVESLATMPAAQTLADAAKCPVCQGLPTEPYQYDPIPYCSACLAVIMPGLERLRSTEQGFGTEAI